MTAYGGLLGADPTTGATGAGAFGQALRGHAEYVTTGSGSPCRDYVGNETPPIRLQVQAIVIRLPSVA